MLGCSLPFSFSFMYFRSLFAFLFFVPVTVLAISFPDVPASYPHKTAIEKLADMGVINGNPSGLFNPKDPVDRAAMLKMLYKAAGITPDSTKKGCFSDVIAGSWYENFVCDAASRGYVKGYEGNLFKPARPVSRVEALKLSLIILGIPMSDSSASLQMYTDVPKSEWFYPFVYTALSKKILPIAGQDGVQLLPHIPLERGEAAAYIWATLQAPAHMASSSSVSSVTSGAEKSSTSSRKSITEKDPDIVPTITVPFSDTPTIPNKKPVSYQFTLSSSKTLRVEGELIPSDQGHVTCRLYRLEKDGYSSEYYLGLEDGKACYIQAALTQGEYQIQIQPTVADAHLTISVKEATGDGNDGFSQAKLLQKGKVRTEVLDSNDLEDWYTFKVGASTSLNTVPGTQMIVNVVSSDKVGCIIYPLADVDLFGFSGPNCNEVYMYPQGTYMVNVRHGLPRASKQTYTLELK